MEDRSFDVDGLRRTLESSLGFRLRELRRLDGASALNFKAVRAEDGFTFAVKCSPPQRKLMFNHLVQHLEVLGGTKAVRRIFAETCPAAFNGLLARKLFKKTEGRRVGPFLYLNLRYRACLYRQMKGVVNRVARVG